MKQTLGERGREKSKGFAGEKEGKSVPLISVQKEACENDDKSNTI